MLQIIAIQLKHAAAVVGELITGCRAARARENVVCTLGDFLTLKKRGGTQAGGTPPR